MSDFRPKELISEAKNALSDASYDPKKLALIHTGVAAAGSLILTVLTYFLDTGIGNTGGLGGLGNRALLQTVQTVLQLLVNVLTPFWALGFVAAALHLSRRQEAAPNSLLTGLRRWGPAIRMLLLEGIIYFAVIMVAVQLGSILYTFTPASAKLQALMEDMIAAGNADLSISDLLMGLDDAALMDIMISMLPFILIPTAVLLIPVAYRLRLAEYFLMDEPRCGAFFAIIASFRLTKGNCLNLFKLDIRYWWYYALEVVVVALSMGNVLLPLLGVPLNMSTVTASVLFYVLALGGQLALYAWKKPQLFATYALFYDHLLPREQAQM